MVGGHNHTSDPDLLKSVQAPFYSVPIRTCLTSILVRMIRAATLLAGLAVPATATSWFSSENQALKLPAWPTSGKPARFICRLTWFKCFLVEKVLLSEEPTPDDFTEESEGGPPSANMLPNFTTLENYPNPMINTMACRRWGMEVSYICDPGKSRYICANCQ